MVVYTAETNDIKEEYGWAFAVGWLVLPIIVIGFVIAFLNVGETRLPRVIIEFRD